MRSEIEQLRRKLIEKHGHACGAQLDATLQLCEAAIVVVRDLL